MYSIRKWMLFGEETLANETGQPADYVRSHYDTMTVTLNDAPGPREIAVIFAAATRGRLHARLGGLKAVEINGQDGLR